MLDIFATGGLPDTAEGSGITHLRATLGQVGEVLRQHDGGGSLVGTAGRDQIIGGAGDDWLLGGEGDDILSDGTGSDHLTGEAGADVFVFAADGQNDWITDFERGVDRMDLSALGRFYSLDALDFTPTPTGAEIRIGGERTIIQTADDRPLTLAEVTISDLRGLSHAFMAPINSAASLQQGTSGFDHLQGRDGNDTLIGGAGADTLIGQAGEDLLIGGGVDQVFDPVSTQIYRLYRATLDRDPDIASLLVWADRLISGGSSLPEVAAGFVNSAEFRNTYGQTTDTAFVTLLYANVLGRTPDAGGLAGWTGLLASGARSREQVVEGFVQSREFIAATAEPLTDWMRSLGPDDRLEAGAGQNLLSGGLWSDTFVFQAGMASQNRVADLEPWDHVVLQGFGYDSAAQARSHMVQDGPDLVFSDQDVTIRFTGTGLSMMTDDILSF